MKEEKGLKAFFANKKYKALTQLIFYFIFFAVIIVLLSMSANQPLPKTNFEKLEEEKNYIYIIDDRSYIVLNGTHITEIIDYDIITPGNFVSMLSNSILIATNYADDYNTYEISVSDYEYIVNGIEYQSDLNILFDVYEDDKIYKIEVKLEEYKGYDIIFEVGE